jgi:adenylate cyclase
VIVAVDNMSLEQLGHFPSWPRSYHATVIDVLTEAGARVIAFDVLFAEPAPGDEQLETSINEAGNVILPLAYSQSNYNSTGAGGPDDIGSFVRPLRIFEEGALAVGHANLLPDKDGIVRKVPWIRRNRAVAYPGHCRQVPQASSGYRVTCGKWQSVFRRSFNSFGQYQWYAH